MLSDEQLITLVTTLLLARSERQDGLEAYVRAAIKIHDTVINVIHGSVPDAQSPKTG